MRTVRGLVLLIAVLLPSMVFAQGSDDAAVAVKEGQRRLLALVEQSLTDIQDLRLAENRAFFDSQVGSVLWPQDQKRATALFRTAAAELIAAQDLAESKRRSNPDSELLKGQSSRHQLLNIIAGRDAGLALELMVSTRPADMRRALAVGGEKSTKIGSSYQNDLYLVESERALEQRLYRQAAEQSPERAVKLLKESLSKGLTNDTINLLYVLGDKDPGAAAEMASQVADKLLHASYVTDGQPSYTIIQLTNSLLTHYAQANPEQEQKVKFNDSQMRDLAAKFVAAYLSDKRIEGYIGSSLATIAEKLAPGSVEAIKNAMKARSETRPSPAADAAYQKLMSADTPAEQLLASANKFPANLRSSIYQNASNKYISQGDLRSARAVLEDNFSDDVRDRLLGNFDQNAAYNLMNEGKYTEAEQLIDGLPDDQRVGALVNLSNTVLAKDPKENRTYALALLQKAIQSIGEHPENSSQMAALQQVIAGYATIDPSEAIRLCEGLTPRINELIAAAAVINGFQRGSNVHEGEFVMSQGDPLGSYGSISSFIGPLAKFDFDRTTRLIDSFTRQEMRISLRLQLAATLIDSNGGSSASIPIEGRIFKVDR